MHNNQRAFKKMNRLDSINTFLSVFFWILIIFGFDDAEIASLTVLSAVIHECGHIFYCYLGIKKRGNLRGTISGFRIKSQKGLSYKQTVRIYLAGPLANLVAATIGLLLMPYSAEYAKNFIIVNVITAFSNLLPIEGYDGYGVLKTLAEKNDCTGTWEQILSIISFALMVILCIFSLYLMVRCDGGYWIYAIFITSILQKLGKMLKKYFCDI